MALIFLHIPKSAGTAVGVMLAKQFKPEEVFHITHRQDSGHYRFHGAELIQGDEADLARRDPPPKLILSSGHPPIFSVPSIAPLQHRYVTMLRDPIERAISQFAQHCRNVMAPGEVEKPRTLQEWMDRFPGQAFNLQTRLLCGPDASWPRPLVTPVPPLTQEHLERAKQNVIDHVAVIGLYERPARFLDDVGAYFGTPAPALEHKHVLDRPRRADFGASQLRQLEEGNALDRELCDFVSDRLRQQDRSARCRCAECAAAGVH